VTGKDSPLTMLIAATMISTAKDPNPLNNWAMTAIKLG
jgi:hypothetical protein